MDMRVFTSAPDKDITNYAPPENYELYGKQFTVTYDGGERETLAFPTDHSPHCVKIKEAIWLVTALAPASSAVYVLDLEANLVTRAVPTPGSGFGIAIGALDGSSGQHHILTDELSGNTVEWTLGMLGSSVIRVDYKDGAVILARPFAPDAPKLSAEFFSAVKISDTVYLQTAVVKCDEAVTPVCLLSDFHRVLCAGRLFGPDNDVRMIGGHGRYPHDAYQKVPAMDLRALSPFDNGSIRQYMQPHCFELAGKTFEFFMDDGYDYNIHFLSSDILEWNITGEPSAKAKYRCCKADDTTYLVSYELSDISPRVNHTFVIDLENMMATRIIASIGKNPRWPYLTKTEFEFGAINDGKEFKPFPRTGFTSELTGNIAQWAYGSEMTTVHVYYCSDSYRITYPRDRVPPDSVGANFVFTEILGILPSSDEATFYMKIKEGMYLISLTEIHCEKLLGVKAGFRSNTLCFLQNYKRGIVVGRAFGTTTQSDGTDAQTNITIGAYGRIVEAVDDDMKSLLIDPNPYMIN